MHYTLSTKGSQSKKRQKEIKCDRAIGVKGRGTVAKSMLDIRGMPLERVLLPSSRGKQHLLDKQAQAYTFLLRGKSQG